MLKKGFSLLLVSLQLFLGYLAYQNYKASKEEARVIKKEIIVRADGTPGPAEVTGAAPDPGQVQQSLRDSAPAQTVAPENPHEKSSPGSEGVDLSSEASVNGLTIGRTTPAEAIARLGKPTAIHGGTVYVFENLNLYFKDGTLIGFNFPGFSRQQAREAGHDPIPFKTSSGLTVGTPMEKVLARFGSGPVAASGKISYRDAQHGLLMNITFQDNAITNIEVGKLDWPR